MTNKFYAGIGSRETPDPIIKRMLGISSKLSEEGYTLRSGGADGADLAFEACAERKEIYLPWAGFNNSSSSLFIKSFSKEIQEKQKQLARKYHPVYDDLSYGAQCMMRRNMHQILGMDLDTPCNFVICWTKNGKDIGGTGTALRCARDHNIPVYNIYNEDEYNDFVTMIKMESFYNEN